MKDLRTEKEAICTTLLKIQSKSTRMPAEEDYKAFAEAVKTAMVAGLTVEEFGTVLRICLNIPSSYSDVIPWEQLNSAINGVWREGLTVLSLEYGNAKLYKEAAIAVEAIRNNYHVVYFTPDANKEDMLAYLNSRVCSNVIRDNFTYVPVDQEVINNLESFVSLDKKQVFIVRSLDLIPYKANDLSRFSMKHSIPVIGTVTQPITDKLIKNHIILENAKTFVIINKDENKETATIRKSMYSTQGSVVDLV